MKIHCVYRSVASENTAPRPDFYSKDVALASFLSAISVSADFVGDVIFLNDGPGVPGHRLEQMERIGEVIQLPGLGNSGSYRSALTTVVTRDWPGDDVVYFSEDDYLYRRSALRGLHAAACSVRSAAYFTLYDYPGYHPITLLERDVPDQRVQARYLRRHRQCRWEVNSIEWRAVRGTTMSFGARVEDLRRDLWIHFLGTTSAIPNDGLIWDATHSLIGQGALPALFRFANRRDRVYRNARRGAITMKASWDSRTRRDLLIAPSPSLATHMHLPYLAPNVDWVAEAALMALG
jgi:hypothetical protein